MKTPEELAAELERDYQSECYDKACMVVVASTSIGDREFADVAARAAIILMQKGYKKNARRGS